MRQEPVFETPWHAQVFALTVHLSETGRFDWPTWTERFGATLMRHGLGRELNGGDDYFQAWLETLEDLLADDGGVSANERMTARHAWERAYRETPHGAPVALKRI